MKCRDIFESAYKGLLTKVQVIAKAVGHVNLNAISVSFIEYGNIEENGFLKFPLM